MNIWGPGGLTGVNIAVLIGYACIGLDSWALPRSLSDLCRLKTKAEINKGTWVAIIFTLVTDAAAVTIGLLARYFFTEAGVDPVAVLRHKLHRISLIHLVNFYCPCSLSAYISQ